MNYEGITLIILLCYIFGEIYKVIYKSEPSMILEANNIYIALFIGLISGASSTGANQIVKQVFMKDKAKDETRL